MADFPFNVRVYGLTIWNDKILLTDERRFGHEFTKFPGGGLEYGEGTVQCLKREFIEEIGQEPEKFSHFYTTDFFQLSAFHNNTQIISIYYQVEVPGPKKIEVVQTPFDFNEPATNEKDQQVFRWLSLNDLSPEDVTFPIDQVVVKKLVSG